jgi:hypothetical protein
VRLEYLADRPLGVLAEPDRVSDRRRDQPRIADRRKIDEVGAARIVGADSLGNTQDASCRSLRDR